MTTAAKIEIREIRPDPFWVVIATCAKCGFFTTFRVSPTCPPVKVMCRVCGSIIEVDTTRMKPSDVKEAPD